MIITRTPFRISFFGGGTDYPVWFREHEGAVLATTINKYCYLSVRLLPPFFDYKSRVVWSKIELIRNLDEIEHPSVQATLKFLDFNQGVVIHHDADLPARTGLGSSSTFTVGLLNAVYGLKKTLSDKNKLAKEAIHIEQNLLKENVGCQDQIMASFGGFNRIDFSGENDFRVSPVILPQDTIITLQNHLLLFYTGQSRTASLIAKEQVEKTKERKKELREMHGMVEEGIRILTAGGDLTPFGDLLHASWKIKRGLTNKISNSQIDEIYEKALVAGATGGKILGAGGGGFMLIFAKPEYHESVKKSLSHLLHVPFRFETSGSQIVYYESSAV